MTLRLSRSRSLNSLLLLRTPSIHPLTAPMSQQISNKSKSNHHRRNRNDSPTVALSKTLSWLLRHHLDESGLEVRSDGYVRLDALLLHPKFKPYTIPQIKDVVANNDKQRFSIKSFDTPDGVQEFIRANQGHSVKTVKIEMEPILSTENYPTIIHGTDQKAWLSISQDPKGLRRMRRNHIHFATGLLGEEGVISGMRFSATVLIYIDLEKALKDGILFYRSENGVVLTEGLNNEGYLPREYFLKVVTRRGDVLWEPESAKDTEK